MSDTQLDLQELRDSIREFLAARSEPRAVREAADHGRLFDPGLWDEIAALGWLALATPEDYGGLGLGFDELAVLYEELGRHLTPAPVLGSLLAAEAFARAGSTAQKQAWLPRLAAGQARASVGLSFGERAPPPRIDDDGRVSGRVANLLFVSAADLFVLPAAAASGERRLVLIEAGAAGLRVEPQAAIDVTRELGAVVLTQADADLLTPSARDWTALLDHAGAAIAADSIGGAANILERTIEYMKTRVQFGRPIGSFQALKHRAAHWKVQLEAAAALSRTAASALAADAADSSAMASRAKFYAADTYAAIAGDAIQLHGGIGFTWEHECHLFFKRAKLNQVLFGDATAHKERVAELALLEGADVAATTPPARMPAHNPA